MVLYSLVLLFDVRHGCSKEKAQYNNTSYKEAFIQQIINTDIIDIKTVVVTRCFS